MMQSQQLKLGYLFREQEIIELSQKEQEVKTSPKDLTLIKMTLVYKPVPAIVYSWYKREMHWVCLYYVYWRWGVRLQPPRCKWSHPMVSTPTAGAKMQVWTKLPSTSTAQPDFLKQGWSRYWHSVFSVSERHRKRTWVFWGLWSPSHPHKEAFTWSQPRSIKKTHCNDSKQAIYASNLDFTI